VTGCAGMSGNVPRKSGDGNPSSEKNLLKQRLSPPPRFTDAG
jgi:hypothetical protein